LWFRNSLGVANLRSFSIFNDADWPRPDPLSQSMSSKVFSIFAAVGQSLQSSRARNSGESSQQKSLNMISNFRQTLARVKKKLAWGRIWKPFELGDCSISSVISSG
jgi:hypothetical protein